MMNKDRCTIYDIIKDDGSKDPPIRISSLEELEDISTEICENILIYCPPVREGNAREVLRAHIKNYFAVNSTEILDDTSLEAIFSACYRMLCRLRKFKPIDH